MNREPGAQGDLVALGVVGCLLGLALIIWVWGGLAGWLFGGGWPASGPGLALEVLVRIPAHLRAPRDAWPPASRALLPGAGACWLTLAGVIAGAVGLARAAGRALDGFGPGTDRGQAWAGRGELRLLTRGRRREGTSPVRLGPRARSDSGGGRLVLGRSRGRLLHAERRHALVAFGPPQSGKSAGLAVPALLEWNGPVVASSVKTDLLATTVARRRQLGRVYVFDPFELGGMRSHTWSPLHAAATWDGALESAWRLAAAGELDQRGVEGGDFWAVAAEQRLAPLLLAAATTGLGMDAVVRWAYGQDAGGLHRTLLALGQTTCDPDRIDDANAAYDANRAFEAQADRTRSSIEGTVQALLRAYRFSRVARSASSSQITPARLLDEAATLYVVGDAKASKLLRPLFVALISEIVDHAYERATLAGGRLERPLLLCLDEAGNVAPLPNLAEIASTAPSHNIQILTIFHDLAQARSRYGRQAETVINSHRARMLLPGVADLDTLKYFSALAGDADVRDDSFTSGAGGRTRSVARRRRPLVAPEALRQLPEGHALLVYGRIAPTRLRLRLWFEDRRLRRLASGPARHSAAHPLSVHANPDQEALP
jgi:type IV secretion system protein VirD4